MQLLAARYYQTAISRSVFCQHFKISPIKIGIHQPQQLLYTYIKDFMGEVPHGLIDPPLRPNLVWSHMICKVTATWTHMPLYIYLSSNSNPPSLILFLSFLMHHIYWLYAMPHELISLHVSWKILNSNPLIMWNVLSLHRPLLNLDTHTGISWLVVVQSMNAMNRQLGINEGDMNLSWIMCHSFRSWSNLDLVFA